MKRLTVRLYVYVFAPLRHLSGALAFLMLASLAAAQQVNPYGNNVFAFFSDPAMFALTVSGISGWLTELITDAFKDRNFQLRGWHTRLLAGGGGFFGLSYFTGTSGWAGAGTAAGMALGAWLFADVKHRAGVLRRTGQRQEARDAFTDAVSDTVLEGLLAAAKLIPPPFSLLVSEATIRSLYESEGAAFVRSLLERTRALTVEEAEAATEATQKDRQISIVPTGSEV